MYTASHGQDYEMQKRKWNIKLEEKKLPFQKVQYEVLKLLTFWSFYENY